MSASIDQFYGPLYGSLYIATVMSTAFYGFTCMQTFFYYVHYPTDPLHFKIFAGLAWALNTIHEALTIAGVYKYVIAGLVNPSSFVDPTPELLMQYIPTALLAVSTQGFLVYRIYIFSGKKIVIPLVWVFLAVLEFVCGNMYVAKSLYSANGAVQVVDISTLDSGPFEIVATISLSVAAGIDVLIAICMTFLLVREWKVTTFRRTEHLLQRLAIFAVNTGTWTAVYALLSIILLHRFPTKVLYAMFSVPLGSVYCNTILANLNARIYLRGGSVLGTNIDSTAFDLHFPASSASRPRASDTTTGNNQSGEAGEVSCAYQGACKSIEMVKLPDVDRAV